MNDLTITVYKSPERAAATNPVEAYLTHCYNLMFKKKPEPGDMDELCACASAARF